MTTAKTAKTKEGGPPRDETYYERVREALDEDAVKNQRLGWDDPASMLSERYRNDPLIAARAKKMRRGGGGGGSSP
jgi:hypothetical protein